MIMIFEKIDQTFSAGGAYLRDGAKKVDKNGSSVGIKYLLKAGRLL